MNRNAKRTLFGVICFGAGYAIGVASAGDEVNASGQRSESVVQTVHAVTVDGHEAYIPIGTMPSCVEVSESEPCAQRTSGYGTSYVRLGTGDATTVAYISDRAAEALTRK